MDKKWTKPLIIFPIIIILFVLYYSLSFDKDKEQYDAGSSEAKLEQALSQIHGVGQVKVYFHYDTATNNNNLMGDYFQQKNNNRKISGLLVVSEGATSPAIQNELVKIISRVMEIPTHRIVIVPMESKGDEK